MILFNVTPTRADGHTPTETLIERTSKWWTCADAKLTEYGDYALPVETNTVAGIFAINTWTRDSNGKVVLDLVDLAPGDPLLGWVGLSAPVPWLPGQRQPFKYVARKGMPLTPLTPDRTALLNDFAEGPRRRNVATVREALAAHASASLDDQAEAVVAAQEALQARTAYRYMPFPDSMYGGQPQELSEQTTRSPA